MVTTEVDVDTARARWATARRDLAFEHSALRSLVTSRKDALEKFDSQQHVDAWSRRSTRSYRDALAASVERVASALAHVDAMASHYDSVYSSWRLAIDQRRADADAMRAVTNPAFLARALPAVDGSPPLADGSGSGKA